MCRENQPILSNEGVSHSEFHEFLSKAKKCEHVSKKSRHHCEDKGISFATIPVKVKDKFWNPGYGDKFVDNCDTHEVPLRRATAESVKKYATIVTDFGKETVTVRQWPQEGKRPLLPGTGVQAGVSTGHFKYVWNGDVSLAVNEAAEADWLMITGRLPKDVSPSNRTHVLVREANYHPDGSQVFYPCNGNAFVILLAPPGDDVKPEDFEAFYVDGTFGLNVKPLVWHQPLYPADDEATYIGKQCAVYACVSFDSVNEFGTFLRVPLKL